MTRSAVTGRSHSTPAAGSVPVAHEYLRVSIDRSGQERSTTDQHEDNERARARYSWAQGRTYRDTASASRYGRKRRDDFARLVQDLQSAEVFSHGDVLRLWESNRGSRKQAEWASFLDLCQERGVRIYVTSHDRVYDLDNPRDRRTLDEDGTDAAYESAKTSLRILRDMAANAAKGQPHGRAQYGYRHVYDPSTGNFLRREDEAGNIRELYDRLAARQSLRSIARDWEARGIRTRSGKVFTPEHLRSMALTAAYAGFRVHNPGVANTHGRIGAGGMVYPANWPALVDPGVFYTVQEFLTDPARNKGAQSRPGRAVHFLTGIGHCDVCGSKLAARRQDGRAPTYLCHGKGCVRVIEPLLDAYVEDVLLTVLESEDVYAALVPQDADTGPALSAVRAELAGLHARHRELASAVAAGQLSALLASHAEPEILAGIQAAQAREQQLSTPRLLDGLITPGVDVRVRWRDTVLSTRREVARLLLTPTVLGQLRVAKTSGTGPNAVPIQGRVSFRKAA